MTDTQGAHNASNISAKTSKKQLLEDRIQARRLLKELRSDDPSLSRAAALRFKALKTLSDLSLDEILRRRDRLQLKHALALMAQTHGFASWKERKDAVRIDDAILMYNTRLDVLLNRWFSQHQYDQALVSLAEQGGFLLPYKHHFFICEAEGIRILGLDPEDLDWRKIGWNWVEPKDLEAQQRLRAQRLAVLRS